MARIETQLFTSLIGNEPLPIKYAVPGMKAMYIDTLAKFYWDGYAWLPGWNDSGAGDGLVIKGKDTYENIIAISNATEKDTWIVSEDHLPEASKEDALTWTGSSWVNIGSLKGEKGEKGDTGSKGDVGDQGDKGDTGTAGLEGAKGDQGVQGVQGTQGPKGDDGVDGTGVDVKGHDTYENITALSGAAGDMWILSVDYNASNLQGEGLVSNGSGAGEANWSNVGSIQGPKGDDGIQGIQGVQGDKGDTGSDGVTLPQDQVDALNGSNAPSASNVFVTGNELDILSDNLTAHATDKHVHLLSSQNAALDANDTLSGTNAVADINLVGTKLDLVLYQENFYTPTGADSVGVIKDKLSVGSGTGSSEINLLADATKDVRVVSDNRFILGHFPNSITHPDDLVLSSKVGGIVLETKDENSVLRLRYNDSVNGDTYKEIATKDDITDFDPSSNQLITGDWVFDEDLQLNKVLNFENTGILSDIEGNLLFAMKKDAIQHSYKLNITGTPTGNEDLTNKGYVDSILNNNAIVITWAELVIKQGLGNVKLWDRYQVSDQSDKKLEIYLQSPNGDSYYQEIDDSGVVTISKIG